MIVPVPVPRYQIPVRGGCSFFLYHCGECQLLEIGKRYANENTIVVISISDGATADSKQPSRTLVVMRPA